MIYDITIYLWYSGNSASIKDIKKNVTKSDKKILSGVVALDYNQVCNQTLSVLGNMTSDRIE